MSSSATAVRVNNKVIVTLADGTTKTLTTSYAARAEVIVVTHHTVRQTGRDKITYECRKDASAGYVLADSRQPFVGVYDGRPVINYCIAIPVTAA
jgi:hypothetical protein